MRFKPGDAAHAFEKMNLVSGPAHLAQWRDHRTMLSFFRYPSYPLISSRPSPDHPESLLRKRCGRSSVPFGDPTMAEPGRSRQGNRFG